MSEDRIAALRFALTRDRRLALWKAPDGTELAGLTDWQGGSVRLGEAEELARLEELARAAGAAELPGWAVRLLAAHGAPCRLRTLERVLSGGAPVDEDSTLKMSAQAVPGTDFETLAAYVDGTLAAERRAEIEALLATDPVAAKRVAELRALQPRLAARRAPARRSPAPVPPPPVATSETASWRGAWIGVGAALGLAAIVGVVAVVVRLVGGGPEPSQPGAGDGSAPATAAAEPAAPRVELFDGERRIAVTGDGELEGLEGISRPLERRVVEALLDGELPAAESIAALRTPRPSLPEGVETPPAELLAPVGTRVLEELPVFGFRLGEEVRSARVRVADLAGREVAASPELARGTTEWIPEQRLPRGRVLVWRLELRVPGGERRPWPESLAEAPRFELVRIDELAYAERELAAARGSRLAATVLYTELGVLDEARAALAELARDNPGAPGVGRLRAALGDAGR